MPCGSFGSCGAFTVGRSLSDIAGGESLNACMSRLIDADMGKPAEK